RSAGCDGLMRCRWLNRSSPACTRLPRAWWATIVPLLRKVPDASGKGSFEAFDRFFDILAAVEGTETEIAFAGGAEPAAGGADQVPLLQQAVEEVPASHALGSLEPHVRGIDPAVDVDAAGLEPLADDAGVGEVEVDQLLHLVLAVGGVDRLGRPLDDVRGAIELGVLPPGPQRVQRLGGAVFGLAGDVLGDDRVAAARAGEARVL